MQVDKNTKREILKQTIASIIKGHRLKQNKSISLICNEIEMTKSMWADLEKGIKDPQLSTLIRISEALNIKISTLIYELEEKLGDDFSLVD